MGAFAAQFEFAAEIVAFLVAVTGLALIFLRGRIYATGPSESGALALGFAALAASAFVHGAEEPAVSAPVSVVALRLGSALVLGGVAAFGWVRRRQRRRRTDGDHYGIPGLEPLIVLPGAGAIAAAGAVSFWNLDGSEALVLAGSLLLGASITWASRGSIGARLTANAAATLVLIVVVLSVSLSTVLSDTIRNDALRRLQSQADAVASTASTSWEANLKEAKLLSASVEGLGLDQPVASGQPGARTRLQRGLQELSTEFFADVGLEWVVPPDQVVALSPGFASVAGPGASVSLARSELMGRAIATGDPAGTAGVAAHQALAVAVYPDVSPTDHHVIGVATVVTPLGSQFLNQELLEDSTLSGALMAGGQILSAYPTSAVRQPAAILSLSAAALSRRATPTAAVGDLFAAAAPVIGGSGAPVLAAVVETPTSEVDATRQSLFRTLFLIALGGSLIAFLLSVFVSDRINRGLNRLTSAARRISTGETLVRTGFASADEIGTLGEAFDSMAESIEDQAAALRRAAAEEADLRGRLQSVVAGMAEALVALDGEGLISEFNPAAERLLGRKRRQAVGRPASTVLDVRMDDGLDLADRLRAGGNGSLSGRGSLRSRQGPVPVAVSVGRLANDGQGAAGTVVLLSDLRSEQELERMKTEFLSRVGHELRTPLTAILGFTQLLATRPVPPEQTNILHGQILDQSNRLLRTVEMLEFFASAGANRLGLDRRETSPKALVEASADRWRERWPLQRLSVRVPKNLPNLDVDPRWVGLALDELVDNAVKFSPDGGSISVVAEYDGGPFLSLRVTDRGQGMTSQELASAFEEFVQGDSSDTRRFGGLGLGLALVKTVAEAHGGRVEAVSTPGRGSTFTVWLPKSESSFG